MARICDVTGKRALAGNKVSHSNHSQEPNAAPVDRHVDAPCTSSFR